MNDDKKVISIDSARGKKDIWMLTDEQGLGNIGLTVLWNCGRQIFTVLDHAVTAEPPTHAQLGTIDAIATVIALKCHDLTNGPGWPTRSAYTASVLEKMEASATRLRALVADPDTFFWADLHEIAYDLTEADPIALTMHWLENQGYSLVVRKLRG